jgi:hypothetical protein
VLVGAPEDGIDDLAVVREVDGEELARDVPRVTAGDAVDGENVHADLPEVRDDGAAQLAPCPGDEDATRKACAGLVRVLHVG